MHRRCSSTDAIAPALRAIALALSAIAMLLHRRARRAGARVRPRTRGGGGRGGARARVRACVRACAYGGPLTVAYDTKHSVYEANITHTVGTASASTGGPCTVCDADIADTVKAVSASTGGGALAALHRRTPPPPSPYRLSHHIISNVIYVYIYIYILHLSTLHMM